MVQKEVMKKTKTYGIIGILLASMCVALIYSYGTNPNSPFPFPSVSPTGTPGGNPSGTSGGTPSPYVTNTPGTSNLPNPSIAPTSPPTSGNAPEPETSPMKTFTSLQELEAFLNATNPNLNVVTGTGFSITTAPNVDGSVTAGKAPVPAPTSALAPSQTNSETNRDYSTTNVQVAGVDEADTVKTDGKFLYVIGNNSQVVYILDANPSSAKVLAKIFLNNTYLSGIYLSNDGSKLAVLGNQYVPYDYFGKVSSGAFLPVPMPPYYNSGSSFVKVYDVTNKANPVLVRNFTITGNYVNSRLIGDYVYDIVSQSAWLTNGTAVLPAVFSGANAYSIPPTSVYYANTSDTYYSFTTIVSLNIMNAALTPANKTIMMGGTGNIYVSESNIYITYPVSTYAPIPTNTPTPTPKTSPNANTTNAPVLIPVMPGFMMRPTWQGTAIYRIHVYADQMSFAAQGNVTGSVMSQYSMDESAGYFRIATTSYDYSNTDSSTPWWNPGIQQNNVYVLDLYLKTVGKLENIASGEQLHAARFMGNRAYLVTFQTVDPLFVIDLTQPTAPKVLGNLTIPGYSDFLQPYDATHLIGIGQDVNASIDADKVHTQGAVYYTAILGLKVSLFDVSDVANPKEISKVVIGDRNTYSDALNDPKALLLDPSRNLMVLPVNLYLKINSTATPTPTPLRTPTPTKSTSNATTLPVPMPTSAPWWPADEPQFVWQGAYVFSVDLTNGIQIRGNVTQIDNAAAILANPGLLYMNSYQWMDYNHFINRELYIGNVLYTISDGRVQLNSLDNFALLAKVELN